MNCNHNNSTFGSVARGLIALAIATGGVGLIGKKYGELQYDRGIADTLPEYGYIHSTKKTHHLYLRTSQGIPITLEKEREEGEPEMKMFFHTYIARSNKQ